MAIYQVYPKKRKKNLDFSNYSLTTKLIGVNIFLFLVFWILIYFNVLPYELISISQEGVFENFYFWTFLTSMFMHGGVFHLFVNMLSLFFVGSLIERILGVRRYLALYFISGLFAGFLHILFESVPAVGASGALFGLIGVLIFLTPNLPVYVMFIPIPVKMKYAAPGMLVVLWLITLGTGAPIGNIAHLGGFLVGAFYGLYLRNKFPNKVKAIGRHFS